MNYAEIFIYVNFLKGRKVILRPVELSMAKEMYCATKESEKELRMFMPWENKNVGEARRFIKSSIKKRKDGTELVLSIHKKKTDEIIGTIGIHHFDPFTPSCETGYWIKTSEYGKGFATDALSTLLKFCRDKMGIVRVDARTATENMASQRVLRKCGFIEEGFKKKAELCHGVWHDLKLFGKILQ